MHKILTSASLIAMLVLGGTLSAQETAPAVDGAAAPAADTAENATTTTEQAAAPTEPQPGDVYEKSVHGDWSVRCIVVQDDADICQMYQLLKDADDNAVSEIAIVPLSQGEAVAGASIVAPMETLLAEPILLSIDGGDPKRYGFTVCSARPLSPLLASGCLARVGLRAEELAAFKRGNAGKLVLVPAANPQAKVELTISLSGFTAAYDALSAN